MTQKQQQIAEWIAEKHLGKKNWQRYGTLQRQGVTAAIVEALSLQGNAPRWVKASERLPQDQKKEYIYRYSDKVALSGSGWVISNHLLNKLDIEWLDESPSMKVEAIGVQPEGISESLSIDDCKYLLFYGHNKEKTIDLGANDNGQLDYAITQMFLMLKESTRFDAERVERVFWERIKAIASYNGRSEGDLVASKSNTDDASLATLPCTDSNSIEQVIDRVKTGLWQLSLGTTGFEEATVFSEYVVKKSKELIKLLNNAMPQGIEAGIIPPSNSIANIP